MQTAAGSFTESGVFSVTGIALGNTAQSAYLNGPGADGYKLFGTFSVTGTVAFVGTTALATFTNGTFSLGADLDSNGTVDQLLLTGSGVLPVSQANIPLVGGQAASGGSYIINYDNLMLTALGDAYFIDPPTFFLQLEVSGENESFTPDLGPGDYTGVAVGDASVVFSSAAVPEPTGTGRIGARGPRVHEPSPQELSSPSMVRRLAAPFG